MFKKKKKNWKPLYLVGERIREESTNSLRKVNSYEVTQQCRTVSWEGQPVTQTGPPPLPRKVEANKLFSFIYLFKIFIKHLISTRHCEKPREYIGE